MNTKEYKSILKLKCEKCKKKTWAVGIHVIRKSRKTTLFCNDCAFPNIKDNK